MYENNFFVFIDLGKIVNWCVTVVANFFFVRYISRWSCNRHRTRVAYAHIRRITIENEQILVSTYIFDLKFARTRVKTQIRLKPYVFY